MNRATLLLTAGLLSLLGMEAQPASAADFPISCPRFYGKVQAHQLSVFNNGGSSFSGGLAWTPECKLFSSPFTVRAHLGAAVIKGTALFIMTEYQAFVGFHAPGPMIFELGGGAQTWAENPTTQGALSAQVGMQLPDWKWKPGFIDHVFVGYTILPFTVAVTHEVRVGLGLGF